jgi:hypothetical protein
MAREIEDNAFERYEDNILSEDDTLKVEKVFSCEGME